MLRRTLILTLTLAAVLAVIGVGGASAKSSFKFPFILPPVAPFTQDFIDMFCEGKLDSDGKTVEISCHNSGKLGPIFNAVNPNPPKDAKIFRLPIAVDKGIGSLNGQIRLWFKVWPDGEVTASLYLTGL